MCVSIFKNMYNSFPFNTHPRPRDILKALDQSCIIISVHQLTVHFPQKVGS